MGCPPWCSIPKSPSQYHPQRGKLTFEPARRDLEAADGTLMVFHGKHWLNKIEEPRKRRQHQVFHRYCSVPASVPSFYPYFLVLNEEKEHWNGETRLLHTHARARVGDVF